MEVVEVSVGDLKPYERNPRDNSASVGYVMESIKEFGFKVPIIAEEDGTIIAGHTRLEAAKALGMERVPVVYASDLTPEQAKAFRLADNRVGEFSEWDDGLMELELFDLSDIDMSRFGFDAVADDESEREKKDEQRSRFEAMELKTFEHHDYVVFVFDNQMDWLNVVSRFGLHKVDAGWGKAHKIGLWRVINGSKLVAALGAAGSDTKQGEERDHSA